MSADWCSNYALKIATSPDAGAQLATVTVGMDDDKLTFSWFKSILEYHSKFFVGAFERSFKEANEYKLEMPEDDPDVFTEFMRWVTDHRRKCLTIALRSCLLTVVVVASPPARHDYKLYEQEKYCSDIKEHYNLLARLYVFGDKYMIPRLQNVVINQVILTFSQCALVFCPDTVAYIYSSTMENSPIRRLAVDLVGRTFHDVSRLFRVMCERQTPYNQEFVEEVMFSDFNAWGRPTSARRDIGVRSHWTGLDQCDYHVDEPEPIAQDG